jgi:hypothetical protein
VVAVEQILLFGPDVAVPALLPLPSFVVGQTRHVSRDTGGFRAASVSSDVIWTDTILASCASNCVAVRAPDALTVLKPEGVDWQEARATFFAAKGPVGCVVQDQAISVSLEEIVALGSRDRGESGESDPDILKLEAWARVLAARDRVAGLVGDCELQCETETIFAVVVEAALHVAQRVQLRVVLLTDHAFGHVGFVWG